MDDPTEIFDLVDAHDRVIGTVLRGEAHHNPALVHRSVQILVFASDDRILLQRRSATKDMFPGFLCASASGHVGSGEDYDSTAARELAEELGIAAPLTYLGKALVQAEQETEFTALYVAKSDGPFTFHPTETTGGVLLTFGEVRRGIESGDLAVTPALRVAVAELTRRIGAGEGSLHAFLAQLG
jgi:isopentenyldiphosphate isomerase